MSLRTNESDIFAVGILGKKVGRKFEESWSRFLVGSKAVEGFLGRGKRNAESLTFRAAVKGAPHQTPSCCRLRYPALRFMVPRCSLPTCPQPATNRTLCPLRQHLYMVP